MYRPHHSTKSYNSHWPSLIYNTFCVRACVCGKEKKEDREKDPERNDKWSVHRHTHAHKQPQALGVSLQVLLGAGRTVLSRTSFAVGPQESQFSECLFPGLALASRTDLQSSAPFSQSLKRSHCFSMRTSGLALGQSSRAYHSSYPISSYHAREFYHKK